MDSLGRSVYDALGKMVGTVPKTTVARSAAPKAASETLAVDAARRAAAVSGGAALIPGVGSTLTLLPDLLATFAIQRRMVADIAALYGKTHELRPEVMTALLFGEVAPGAVAPLKKEGSSGFRRVSDAILRRALRKIAWGIARRILGRAVERLVPLVGAAGAGIGSYRGTLGVAKASIAYFENLRGPIPGGRVIPGVAVESKEAPEKVIQGTAIPKTDLGAGEAEAKPGPSGPVIPTAGP